MRAPHDPKGNEAKSKMKQPSDMPMPRFKNGWYYFLMISISNIILYLNNLLVDQLKSFEDKVSGQEKDLL